MKLAIPAVVVLSIGATTALREMPVDRSIAPVPAVVVPADRPETHSADRVAQVSADVRGYFRHGHLTTADASTYQVGDVVSLACTPRDAAGHPTDFHGPLQAWVVDGATLTDADGFSPDLHARASGEVSVACRVDGVTSPAIRLHIAS